MPKKPKTSGSVGSHDTGKLNQIDSYTYPEYDRANIPLVGMAKFDTVASPEGQYAYDPHIDPSLQWAGKKEGAYFEVPTTSIHIHESIKPHKIIRSVQTMGDNFQDPQGWLFESDVEITTRINNAIEFYQHNVRTLDRNISTQYFERLLMSQIKKPVVREMQTKTGMYQKNKLEFIKNPTVLEFPGLPGNKGYSEAVLEKAIIDHLQQFILELGKGFAFVERQYLIRIDTTDYYVDLVFYNFILKCFILIYLKTTRIMHQDAGQMNMYVRMFDELKHGDSDNPTIGILLCSETDKDIARYSILKGNEHLFATKYKLYLPTEEELRTEIERQNLIFKHPLAVLGVSICNVRTTVLVLDVFVATLPKASGKLAKRHWLCLVGQQNTFLE